MNTTKGRFAIIFLFIIVLAGVWFMFLRTSGMGTAEVVEVLEGKWQRSDGPYTIEIIEILEEGKMNAAYFNPGPIHVGRSGWRVKDDVLEIFVELQDKNYPGSVYELKFDDETGQLEGKYFQAVSRQTYNVVFIKQ